MGSFRRIVDTPSASGIEVDTIYVIFWQAAGADQPFEAGVPPCSLRSSGWSSPCSLFAVEKLRVAPVPPSAHLTFVARGGFADGVGTKGVLQFIDTRLRRASNKGHFLSGAHPPMRR
jgi:hypothetical protein